MACMRTKAAPALALAELGLLPDLLARMGFAMLQVNAIRGPDSPPFSLYRERSCEVTVTMIRF